MILVLSFLAILSSALPLKVPFNFSAIVMLICCVSPLRGCNLLLEVQFSIFHLNCSAVVKASVSGNYRECVTVNKYWEIFIYF